MRAAPCSVRAVIIIMVGAITSHHRLRVKPELELHPGVQSPVKLFRAFWHMTHNGRSLIEEVCSFVKVL